MLNKKYFKVVCVLVVVLILIFISYASNDVYNGVISPLKLPVQNGDPKSTDEVFTGIVSPLKLPITFYPAENALSLRAVPCINMNGQCLHSNKFKKGDKIFLLIEIKNLKVKNYYEFRLEIPELGIDKIFHKDFSKVNIVNVQLIQELNSMIFARHNELNIKLIDNVANRQVSKKIEFQIENA